jgi:hypothetical protein
MLKTFTCHACRTEVTKDLASTITPKYCSKECMWAGKRKYDDKPDELECRKCGKVKPTTDYHPHSGIARGYQYWCKECTRHERAERAKTPTDPQLTRKYKLKRYGITPEDYTALYEQQQGRCAICHVQKEPWTPMSHSERSRFLVVDHNHSTGKIRGLLCGGCNTGIGQFKENPEALGLAAVYLRSHQV